MALPDHFTPAAPVRHPAPPVTRCEVHKAFAQSSGASMRFDAGEEIFSQDEPADRAFRIVEGTVISYRLLSDGRRQVTGFHLPGDYLGLEASIDYSSTAEAIGGVTVTAVRRSGLSALASADNGLARDLWRMSAEAFQRSQNHAMILARQSATERVVAFLLDYADRVGAENVIDLPMSRQDMADHLGLALHTVSRTLSHLQAEGLIQARSSRHVRLVRRDRLERIRA